MLRQLRGVYRQKIAWECRQRRTCRGASADGQTQCRRSASQLAKTPGGDDGLIGETGWLGASLARHQAMRTDAPTRHIAQLKPLSGGVSAWTVTNAWPNWRAVARSP